MHNGLLKKQKQPPRPVPVVRHNNRSISRPQKDMPEFDINLGNSSARGHNSFNGAAKMLAAQIPKELNKEEKYILQESIDENKRRGFFKRIFPSVDYLYYRQFFEQDRPLNHILDERLMSKKRD